MKWYEIKVIFDITSFIITWYSSMMTHQNENHDSPAWRIALFLLVNPLGLDLSLALPILSYIILIIYFDMTYDIGDKKLMCDKKCVKMLRDLLWQKCDTLVMWPMSCDTPVMWPFSAARRRRCSDCICAQPSSKNQRATTERTLFNVWCNQTDCSATRCAPDRIK